MLILVFRRNRRAKCYEVVLEAQPAENPMEWSKYPECKEPFSESHPGPAPDRGPTLTQKERCLSRKRAEHIEPCELLRAHHPHVIRESTPPPIPQWLGVTTLSGDGIAPSSGSRESLHAEVFHDRDVLQHI